MYNFRTKSSATKRYSSGTGKEMGIVQMLKEIPYRTECGTLLWISPHAKSSICLFCSSCVVPVNVHSDEQWTSYTVKFSFRWNDEYYVWVHDVALESRLCSVFSFVSGLRTPWYEYTLNTAHVCEHIVVPRIKKSTVHFNGNREHTRMHARTHIWKSRQTSYVYFFAVHASNNVNVLV